MKPFIHHNVRSINEATRLLAAYEGKAKVNAGGTDLLGAMRDQCLPDYPEAVINIKTLKGMDYIKKGKKGIKIGALTNLADIARSADVREGYTLLAEAAYSVASPHIRNMATIGGNLAQDVRCWYYRYPRQIGGPIVCLRKGGNICSAAMGDNRYHSLFGAAPLIEYPCASHCPAGANIPAYLSRVRKGDFKGAAHILIDYNPIPAITGRICPVFCEPECNRKELDTSVSIQCVERGVGDYILERPDEFYIPTGKETGKKVAIVGSGPAGLAAAFYLRRAGHKVTVYERLPEAGGMLRYSIPAFRLPRDVVRKQIQALEGMGIVFKVEVNVGKDIMMKDLADCFDAVFVAGGAWQERSLGIEGELLALSGLAFLNRVNAGSRDVPGKKVAVIGGGNVAIDVARTLLRLGAEPVVIYRRTEHEMPAVRVEVKKAQEEGIAFEFLTLPTAISDEEGGISLTCTRMELGGPDASGRPRPLPIAGSEFTLRFDAVVKAIGEEPDRTILSNLPAYNVEKDTTPSTPLKKGLFAGGDFVTGPSTVIQAIASARHAVRGIELSLGGGRTPELPARMEADFNDSVFQDLPRAIVHELPAAERVKAVDVEDAPSLSMSEIEKEAQRCFNCGCLAVAPSDIAVALVALNARIVTTKRTINAETFFNATAIRSHVLHGDELIKEVQIPKPNNGARQSYEKFTLRKPIDFAIVSVATVLTVRDGICKDASIVLGAVAPEPIRATAAEEFLRGQAISEAVAAKAGDLALEGAMPLPQNVYKVAIAKTLVKRTLMSSAG
ncbi:MAG: pyridine nucleotide-disulfide oxidoreductase [Syntrophus sp. (in: bacteria)]|nr:pyridine nucleotide-disulfide oxidoreductase [Syntrophus sp. (in: bacteria)]